EEEAEQLEHLLHADQQRSGRHDVPHEQPAELERGDRHQDHQEDHQGEHRDGLEGSENPRHPLPGVRAFGFAHVAAAAAPSARRIMNSDSNGTGRPVAPFSFPETAFVPAMSRCAHRYFFAYRDRKQAAVTLPAGRPPRLLMSAKLLLSCSWYSSQSGICHAGSPVSVPHSSSSAASASSLAKSPLATWPSAMTRAPVKVATSTTHSGSKRSA